MPNKATQTSTELPANPDRQTVLVVDDEQDLRSLVATVLTEYGYKVLTASSAAKAVALLAKMATPPDLLLTDVVMPGKSGPMLADDLLARFPAARVLFMSGYDERQVVRRYVVEKGFTLISKPFQLHVLCESVKNALAAADSMQTQSPVTDQVH